VSAPIKNLSTRSKLLNTFALYLMGLAGLISLHAIYQKYVVPLLEGPPNIVQHEFSPPSTELNFFAFDKQNFSSLFPADAWELGDCKVMLAEQGVVLFQEFVRVEGGYLEVLPFTLIMDANVSRYPDSSTDTAKTPTVLRCQRGARLKFDDPYADPLGGKSKLESARLVGTVDIYRPASTPESGDSLEIVTSNVQITNKQIFTLEEVRFAFGANRGWGRQLLIELSQDPTLRTTTTHGFENVTGVRRIELAYLRQLRLEPTASTAAADPAESSPAPGFAKAPIDITCDGSFVLDVGDKTAIFNDRVQVRQDHQDRNELGCQRLTVQFYDPSVTQVDWDSRSEWVVDSPIDSRNQSAAGETALSGSWEIRKLVAEGAPAVLTSEAHDLRMEGDLLSYDLTKGELYARTQPPVARRKAPIDRSSSDNNQGPIELEGSGQPVSIVTPEYQVRSIQLAYRLNPLGGLGQLMAIGPGSLLQMENAKNQEFFLEWKKFLSLEPDGSQHRITVEEECSVRFDKDSILKAQQILLWLEEGVKREDPIAAIDNAPTDQANYLPQRLIATKRVEIISPQLNGKTEKLTAVWEGGDGRQAGNIFVPGEGADGGPRRHRVARPPVRSPASSLVGEWAETAGWQEQEIPNRYTAAWGTSAAGSSVAGSQPNQSVHAAPHWKRTDQPHEVHPWPDETAVRQASLIIQAGQPGMPVIQAAGEGFSQEVSPQIKKYSFQAREVRLQLQAEDNQIQDFTANGQVQLAEVVQPFAKTNQSPLVIRGELLRYLPQAEGLARVLVTGTADVPASLDAERFKLQGNEIHLDQAANKLWVDGRGQLMLDVAGNGGNAPPATVGGLDSGATRYREVKVTWASGMVFNGKKVYFEDQVLLVAEGENAQKTATITRAFGGGVSIELEQEVNFSQMESTTEQQQDIREMIIVEQVAAGRRVFNLANFTPSPKLDRPTDAWIKHQVFGEKGSLVEQLEFFGTQITLISKTGVLNGKGPGAIWHHRAGQPSFMADGSLDRKVPLGGGGPAAAQVAFLRINYDASATASTQQQRMQIRGNVRAVYSPVQSFEQRLNPDDKRSLPADAVVVKCDNMDFAQWTPRNSDQPVQELFANGNAHVTSSDFEAIADRINYNQATDLVIIEGTPRSDAQLWHTAKVGSVRDRKHLVAEKIVYRLKDGNTEVQNIKYLDYKQN